MYDLYEPQEAFEVLLSTSVFVWALMLDVFRVVCKVCVYVACQVQSEIFLFSLRSLVQVLVGYYSPFYRLRKVNQQRTQTKPYNTSCLCVPCIDYTTVCLTNS